MQIRIIALLVALFAGCRAQIKAKVPDASPPCSGATTQGAGCAATENSDKPPTKDDSFEIASVNNGGEKTILVTWQAADFSNIALSVAVDNACKSPIFEITDLKGNSQEVKILATGTFYVCLFGDDKKGARIGAKNNGWKVTLSSDGEIVVDRVEISDHAPTWDAMISTHEITNAVGINIAVSASDADLSDTLAYSLDAANMTCDDTVSWSAALSIDSGTGVLTGTPTGVITTTTCSINVVATSGSKSIGQTFDLVIFPSLAISEQFVTMFAKQNFAFSSVFSAVGGKTPYTYALPTNPGGAVIGATTGIFSYSPSATGMELYVVRATDALGNVANFSFSLITRVYSTCVWTGASNNAWNNSANWRFCGGVAPTGIDRVIIPSSMVNQPILSVSTTIEGIAPGEPSGGTVTVNAGTALTLTHATETVASSVKFRGNSDGCATCKVSTTDDSYVVNDATLTLGRGIAFEVATLGKKMFLGNGTTSGHLATEPASGSSSHWPIIKGSGSTRFVGLIFEGAPSSKSTIAVDGLRLQNLIAYSYSALDFVNHWSIVQMDHVEFYTEELTRRQFADIRLQNCTNATAPDNLWSNIVFDAPRVGIGASYNIDAQGCSGLGPITVSGAGHGFGQPFEQDNNNLISWLNGASLVCTWAGTVSSEWTNSSNWSNCANGRSGFPDQNDNVIIPPLGGAVIYQPEIPPTSAFYLLSVAAGTGGGAITIPGGSSLSFLNGYSGPTISSSLLLKGDTSTCTTCIARQLFNNLSIVNGATLTLGKGLEVQIWNEIMVGDGASHGHLVTTGGAANEWPTIRNGITGTWNGIQIWGYAGGRSTVNINGLNTIDVQDISSKNHFFFRDYFEILSFDNISMNSNGGSYTSSFVKVACDIDSASRTRIVDFSWANLSFLDSFGSGGYNINASDADCIAGNGYQPVVVSGSGIGFGEQFDNDPGNIFTFNVAITPTITGTPTGTNNTTTLAVDVNNNSSVTAYRYKVGADASTDCVNATGYSVEVVEGTDITADISGIPDGAIELCVIVKNSDGNWQSFASANSFIWSKDATSPTFAFGNVSFPDEGLTTKQIQMAWTNASDAVTPPSNILYKVVYSATNNITNSSDATANGILVVDYTSGINVATKTALPSAGTTYYFGIWAKDGVGNATYLNTSKSTNAFCGGGPGTNAGNAWLICDLIDLNSVRDNLSGYFRLNNLIDATATATWNAGSGWLPVGSSVGHFTGEFNGQNFEIKNLFINRSSTDDVGLFGRAAGTVTNVVLRRLNVSGGNYVGGLIGFGEWNGQISNVAVTGQISGISYVGGVIGGGAGSTDISNTISTAGIVATGTYAGGLTGRLGNSSTITTSFTTGGVSSSGASVGGMAGSFGGTVSYSYAVGNVSGLSNVGGLIGRGSPVVSYGFARGNAKSSGTNTGGLIGWLENSAGISYGVAEGIVNGTSTKGGLIGLQHASATLSHSLSTGIVIGASGARGSAVGWNNVGSTMTSVYATNRSGLNCIGTDTAGIGGNCLHVSTGTIKPFDPISFDPIFDHLRLKKSEGRNIRKISASDESAYKIWGGCNTEGAMINVSGDVVASTTCVNSSWSVTLDFSALADGDVTVNVDLAGSGTRTLTLNKETDFCQANPTNNALGFAGVITNDGSTEALALRICSVEQFESLRNDHSHNKHYRLMNSLDLSTGFSGPIGPGGIAEDCNVQACFNFDGNGFRLHSAIILNPTANMQSIFGSMYKYTSPRRYIKNLGVEDSYVVGNDRASLIASYPRYMDISDSYATGGIIGLGSAHGAIVGVSDFVDYYRVWSGAHIIGAGATGSITSSSGTINDSYASGNLISTGGGNGHGGICGWSCTVVRSYATGHQITSDWQAGGIVGAYGHFLDSYSTGSVLTSHLRAGGLVGRMNLAGSSSRGYAAGHVIGPSNQYDIGGMVGVLEGGGKIVDLVFSLGAVTSTHAQSGGGLGYKDSVAGTNLTNSYYWSHALNPAVCIGADAGGETPSCTAEVSGTLPTRFTGNTGDVPSGGSREPLSSWDFTAGTGVWKFSGTGVLPSLRWQNP